MFKNNFDVKKNAKSLMNINRKKFTLNQMAEKLNEIVTPYIDKVPSQVKLNLPKLKKVANSELPKIKLPKLKKITEDS